MCDFGDRIIRRFELVIEGSIKAPLQLQASQKNDNKKKIKNKNKKKIIIIIIIIKSPV